MGSPRPEQAKMRHAHGALFHFTDTGCKVH